MSKWCKTCYRNEFTGDWKSCGNDCPVFGKDFEELAKEVIKDAVYDTIYIAVEHVIHFDWERTNILGASYDKNTCIKMTEEANNDFEPRDGELAEYWVERVLIE